METGGVLVITSQFLPLFLRCVHRTWSDLFAIFLFCRPRLLGGAFFSMATDECRGDQQLDADEEKEEPSSILPGMLGEGKSVRGEQKGDCRAEE